MIATILGFLSVFMLAAQDVGAGVFFFAIGGGAAVAFLMRLLYYGGQMTQKAWIHSTSWADNVGVPADRALEPARRLRDALPAHGVAPATPFTAKARARAQAVIYISWGLLVLGAGMIGYGFLEAADSSGKQTITVPQ